MNQTDLFTGRRIDLPDDIELRRRFDYFNRDLFGLALPRATITWSARMRIAGTCDHRRHVITLSRPYHENFPDDLDDTLKHEMLHLRHPRHDAAFRAEAERIGTSIHCREYPGLHPRLRHVYICPDCGSEYRRAKRERHLYCGRCARGRLDPRFRLVLHNGTRKAALAARGQARRRTTRLVRSSRIASTLDFFPTEEDASCGQRES